MDQTLYLALETERWRVPCQEASKLDRGQEGMLRMDKDMQGGGALGGRRGMCVFSRWVMSFSCDPKDCSQLLGPRDFPGKYTGVGCHFLLQGIFLTLRLLHCRQLPYRLSHQGNPGKCRGWQGWGAKSPKERMDTWDRYWKERSATWRKAKAFWAEGTVDSPLSGFCVCVEMGTSCWVFRGTQRDW